MGKVGFCLAASCAVASCAIAAILVGRMAKRRRKWNRVLSILREFEEGCATPIGKLRQVVDAMAVEMHAGLASEGGSKLKMLLTYVDRLPNGSEKGTYYALHLGGTDFRVLRVQLGGERSPTLEHRITRQPIPPHLMSSTSEDLFNFIASILEQFVEAEGKNMPRDQIRELGFTFSFPVRQTSLSSGVLLNWTKGFKIQGIVGEDVAKLLQQAIDKRGLGIRITALVNDAVGALALGHYHDEDTVVAVIIGTGTNACYVERTDSIIKCQGLLTNSGNMVVNMEWGNFWSTHLPRTSYDADLDAESSNRNEQGFEKMISGMYLGDIVRRVMYRMSQDSGVFGMATEALSVPFSLRTPLVAIMREDDSPDLGKVMRIMKEVFQIEDMPLKERKIVMRLCDVVTRRAARLVAAGIVGILKKIGRDSSGGFVGGRTKGEFLNTTKRTVIVIEGGLYSSYFTFRECLNEALTEILGEDMSQHVELRILEDGSGIGSCLLAAANSSSGGI